MTCIKRISTKNIFQKFEFLDQKFHASEQTKIHASKRTIFHERTNDRALIEILPSEYERAVSISNVVARLSALAQNMVGGSDLSPRTNSYEIEQK